MTLAAIAAGIAFLAIMWEPLACYPLVLTYFCATAAQSPSVVGGGLALICAVGVLSSVNHQGKTRIPAFGALWTCAIAIVMVIQVATHAQGNEVLARYVALVAALLLGLVLYANLSHRNMPQAVLFCLRAVCLGEASLGLCQFFTKSPIVGPRITGDAAILSATEIPGMFRAYGTFAHPNAFGVFLCLCLPVLVFYLPRSGAQGRVPQMFTIAFVTLATLASLSRGVWVALFAVLAFAVLVKTGRRDAMRRRRLVLLLVFLAVAFLGGPFARFNSSQSVADRDHGSNDARVANMMAALRAWEDSPLVGQGFGAGASYGRRFGGYSDLGAHNAYLDVLSGGGLALAVLLFAIFVTAIRACARVPDRGYVLLLGIVLMGVLGLFESLVQAGLASLMSVIGALALAYARKSIVMSETSRPDVILWSGN